MKKDTPFLVALIFTLALFSQLYTQGRAADLNFGAAGENLTESVDSAAVRYRKNIDSLRKELGKSGFKIDSLLNDPRFEIYENIGHRFKHSAERTTPTLDEYKKILNFDEKVEKGTNFIEDHTSQLNEAEKKYGISRYVITAIIGVESNFGKVIGDYNPFNVYVSMVAVDYRSDFAKAQLKELLKFAHRNNLDIFDLKSSYAGAVSYGQFIPYSLNKWFIGNDIFDMSDNIMSVANYLSYFKKRTGSLHTAVLRYNPSDLYTNTVLDLADRIEKRYNSLASK